MKASAPIYFTFFFSYLVTPLVAQVVALKPMPIQKAVVMVNPGVQFSSPLTEKSSLANHATLEVIQKYERTVRISYQIASVNALEWAHVRRRAADILNVSDWNELAGRGLLEPLQRLAWDDYVPMSAYAPLTVRLNFSINSRKTPAYFNTGNFAPANTSPVINTKSLMIRK